ncbi:unnamed protein product [Arctia plantaginis]|uniref:Uncharacterized protein n=1 Tax=Arctia plantaginis TaxID=874455 RepID=A0A8S1BCF7_ARCPL|nr:unnamed protein product [Arctia plantaginis]
MTAKFGYVTTACRLCKDIVPPDGGDLRCGAIDGPVGSPLQPVLPYVRQRVPKRYHYGSLRWKRSTESHHQYARRQFRTAHSLSSAGHVPLLQSLALGRQATDTLPSRETAQLPLQRGVCGRLQQIPFGEERRPLHRVQPARCPTATRQESSLGAAAQMFLVHEGGSRLRYKQAQHNARRRLAQVASAA